MLEEIKANGGTTIRNGFNLSKELLQNFIKENNCTNCENRIIMLTDVGDNSFENEKKFIASASV